MSTGAIGPYNKAQTKMIAVKNPSKNVHQMQHTSEQIDTETAEEVAPAGKWIGAAMARRLFATGSRCRMMSTLLPLLKPNWPPQNRHVFHSIWFFTNVLCCLKHLTDLTSVHEKGLYPVVANKQTPGNTPQRFQTSNVCTADRYTGCIKIQRP